MALPWITVSTCQSYGMVPQVCDTWAKFEEVGRSSIASCILYTCMVWSMQTIKLRVIVTADCADVSEISGRECDGDTGMTATLTFIGCRKRHFQAFLYASRVEVGLSKFFRCCSLWSGLVGIWLKELQEYLRFIPLHLLVHTVYGAYNNKYTVMYTRTLFLSS